MSVKGGGYGGRFSRLYCGRDQLAPLPAAVLIFRDGIFTPYVFLFYFAGFAIVSALIRTISGAKKE
ncbi:MAG: hypothetical protein ACLUSP_08310 [Christensenellales bacterium]